MDFIDSVTSKSLQVTPLYSSIEELNADASAFHDPSRPDCENQGPFLVVRDGFYPEPLAIRRLALQQEYFQYSPPLPEQVGEEVAAQHSDISPAWFSSSLLRFVGQTVADPQPGFRYAPPEVRQSMAQVTGDDVTVDTWDEMGDWWNGAFHILFETWIRGKGAIHHHYKEGDVAPRGWSGVVYLTPDAPPDVGTTIWREKASGRCVASKGAKFEHDAEKFELALLVENRFNRLVLFRENVLHRAEHGFGMTPETARLTQTFFFHAEQHIVSSKVEDS